MSKVELLGPRGLFPAALEFLQARGVLELREPRAPGVSPLEASAEPGGSLRPRREEEMRLEETIRRIDALLSRLPPAREGEPEPLPAPGSEDLVARIAALEAELTALEERRAALVAERDATARFGELFVALAPLDHELGPALEPEVHGLVLRDDPAALALLEGEVRRVSGGAFVVKARPLGEGRTGVLVVVPRAAGRALTALLSERGVEEVKLPAAYAGKRVVEVLFLLVARERDLPGEVAAADRAIASLAGRVGPALASAREGAVATLDRHRAAGHCGRTRFAYVVSGYMPTEAVASLRAEAAAALGEEVAVVARAPDRSEWDEVPVVLRNRTLARPFQWLLGLVALPRYGSVDPTPWLAVFFPLFFGIVLGDVVFGLVGVSAALLVRRAGWGGRVGRDLAMIALWCSVSALVFGVLYGEALGELGSHLGLRPLLLDRRHSIMTFFALALVVGGVHVMVGTALGVVSAVHAGRVREALGRTAKLALLLAAAAAAASLFRALPRAALVPSLVACGAALVVAVVAEGPLAILDVVLGLGNVLSYSRLMAIGLASVMLAEVANRVATSLEPAVAGVALGVFLHAVNFSLGLVSPAIAALRLHYVEFFEKFYEAGGPPYRPFALSPGG